jgi:hypothetical protein
VQYLGIKLQKLGQGVRRVSVGAGMLVRTGMLVRAGMLLRARMLVCAGIVMVVVHVLDSMAVMRL